MTVMTRVVEVTSAALSKVEVLMRGARPLDNHDLQGDAHQLHLGRLDRIARGPMLQKFHLFKKTHVSYLEHSHSTDRLFRDSCVTRFPS